MDAVADSHPAPWLRQFQFNSENARIAAQKSHAPDSARNADKQAQPAQDQNGAQSTQRLDAELSDKLARVQLQLVNKMIAAKGDPKAIASLPRQFRDLREAFHLVTGQAKPGVIRESNPRNRQRNTPKPQPLPDDGPPDANQS